MEPPTTPMRWLRLVVDKQLQEQSKPRAMQLLHVPFPCSTMHVGHVRLRCGCSCKWHPEGERCAIVLVAESIFVIRVSIACSCLGPCKTGMGGRHTSRVFNFASAHHTTNTTWTSFTTIVFTRGQRTHDTPPQSATGGPMGRPRTLCSGGPSRASRPQPHARRRLALTA